MLRVIDEMLHQRKMLGFLIWGKLHTTLRQCIYLRPGAGYEDGRVGRNDELAVLQGKLVDTGQQGELAG